MFQSWIRGSIAKVTYFPEACIKNDDELRVFLVSTPVDVLAIDIINNVYIIISMFLAINETRLDQGRRNRGGGTGGM